MSHIKQVDIGKVYSVEDEFSNHIQPDEVVHGCLGIKGIISLGLQCFICGPKSNEALKWFSETEGTFLVVLGGDACPLGKNTNACMS